jgi:hypothetical protein
MSTRHSRTRPRPTELRKPAPAPAHRTSRSASPRNESTEQLERRDEASVRPTPHRNALTRTGYDNPSGHVTPVRNSCGAVHRVLHTVGGTS